jgi:hypothetical protein
MCAEITMSTTQMSSEQATRIPTAPALDLKLEVVLLNEEWARQ